MSSQLSERDQAVIELIENDSDGELDAEDYRETIQSLTDRMDEMETEVATLRTKVDTVTNRLFSRVDDLESQVDATGDDDVPPIVRKARMTPEEREDNLSKSEHLAVLLHEFWDEIRWEMGATGTDIHGNDLDTKFGVDTKSKANAKYSPSKLKYRLKEYANHDLHSMQVYRALQRLAKDSGGSEYTKNGRVEIRGGTYEYREVATPDGKDTRRVVWRDAE